MKIKVPYIMAASVLAVITPAAHAAYTFSGLSITENFNTMPTSTVAGVFSATNGVQAAISGTGFVGTKLSGTNTTTAIALTADNGSGNSGGLYSYGAATVAERAVGATASGTNIMGFGFEVVNGGSDTITEITISLTQENWRTSTTTVNTFASSYAVGAAGSTSFLSAATGFTAASALSLVGPAVVASNGLIDGNLAINQVARSLTISGLTILAGESFYLRWQDVNDAGNDAALAVDDLSLTFVTAAVPEPQAAALLGVVGLLGIFRRRR
ncbi:MAG: PEP-CTERM sorting domain-containing protein [Luteolibacter sp.]|uniref:PEP-CTERM sorting domain-containing protein n=1 Tax=Luteolibacter sp. TaxID=1962973 RepID=UPI00326710CC